MNRRYRILAILAGMTGMVLAASRLFRRQPASLPEPIISDEAKPRKPLPETVPPLEILPTPPGRIIPTLWTLASALLGAACFIAAQALLLDAPRAVIIPVGLYAAGFLLLQPVLRFHETTLDKNVETQAAASLQEKLLKPRWLYWAGLLFFAVLSAALAQFGRLNVLLLFAWVMLVGIAVILALGNERLLSIDWRHIPQRHLEDAFIILGLMLLATTIQLQIPAPAPPLADQISQFEAAQHPTIIPLELTVGPLFQHLQAVLAWFSGGQIESFLRLNGIFALLIIPAVYLGSYALGGRWMAAMAAGFAAVSGWTLALGKVGALYAALAVVSALYLAALRRTQRQPSRASYMWLGLLLGLGWLISPLFIFMALLPLANILTLRFVKWGFLRRPSWPSLRRVLAYWLIMFLVMGAVVLPVIAVLAPQIRDYEPPPPVYGFGLSNSEVFLDALAHALLMFNITSDPNPLHGLVYRPVFSPILAGLFLMGLLGSVHQLYRTRRWSDALLLLALVVGLIPAAALLTPPIRYPDIQRGALALPIAFYFAAAGVMVIGNACLSRWRKETVLTITALIIVALVLIASDARWHYTQEFLPAYEQAAPMYNQLTANR